MNTSELLLAYSLPLQHLLWWLAPMVLVLAGVLAIKLPGRFNPFQLRSGVAQFFSEEKNVLVPKILGWVMIGFGCLWFIAVLALYLLLQFGNDKGDPRESIEQIAAANLAEEKMRAETLASSIGESDSYTVLSSRGQKMLTAAKRSQLELAELKNLLKIEPRERLDRTIFLIPNIVLQFHKGEEITAQLKMSIGPEDTGFMSLDVRSDTQHVGRLDKTATERLITVLRQHDHENLIGILDRLDEPGDSQAD